MFRYYLDGALAEDFQVRKGKLLYCCAYCGDVHHQLSQVMRRHILPENYNEFLHKLEVHLQEDGNGDFKKVEENGVRNDGLIGDREERKLEMGPDLRIAAMTGREANQIPVEKILIGDGDEKGKESPIIGTSVEDEAKKRHLRGEKYLRMHESMTVESRFVSLCELGHYFDYITVCSDAAARYGQTRYISL